MTDRNAGDETNATKTLRTMQHHFLEMIDAQARDLRQYAQERNDEPKELTVEWFHKHQRTDELLSLALFVLDFASKRRDLLEDEARELAERRRAQD